MLLALQQMLLIYIKPGYSGLGVLPEFTTMLQLAPLLHQKNVWCTCTNTNLSVHIARQKEGSLDSWFNIHGCHLYGFGANAKNERQILYKVDWGTRKAAYIV